MPLNTVETKSKPPIWGSEGSHTATVSPAQICMPVYFTLVLALWGKVCFTLGTTEWLTAQNWRCTFDRAALCGGGEGSYRGLGVEWGRTMLERIGTVAFRRSRGGRRPQTPNWLDGTRSCLQKEKTILVREKKKYAWTQKKMDHRSGPVNEWWKVRWKDKPNKARYS